MSSPEQKMQISQLTVDHLRNAGSLTSPNISNLHSPVAFQSFIFEGAEGGQKFTSGVRSYSGELYNYIH